MKAIKVTCNNKNARVHKRFETSVKSWANRQGFPISWNTRKDTGYYKLTEYSLHLHLTDASLLEKAEKQLKRLEDKFRTMIIDFENGREYAYHPNI